MIRSVYASACLVLLLGIGGGAVSTSSAHATDCAPLRQITMLKMLPAEERAVLVSAQIDGHDETMLVDTGGFFSELFPAAVKTLGLTLHHTRLGAVGIAGHTTDSYVRVKSFALGQLYATNVDFMVRDAGYPEIDGTIAPNLLKSYDVEFDFAAGEVKLLSPDHCPGKVIYWPAAAATVVPIHVAHFGHIIVPAVLDGVTLRALIDTGASHSVLNAADAKSLFDLNLGSQDTPATHKLDGTDLAVYRHRFKQLTIGGIGIANPTLEIIPDMMKNHIDDSPPTGTRLSSGDDIDGLPDLIVGLDILHHLHLYVAYGEDKLYVTPAAAPKTASSPE